MIFKDNPRLQGALMLLGACALFYIGHYFRAPLVAEGRLLVATEKAENPHNPFRRTVIFMAEHHASGALGYIVNSPVQKDGFATGGPVDDASTAVLILDDKGAAIKIMPVAAFDEMTVKPKWFLKLTGYTGWGARQLDGELRRDMWAVIPFDAALITQKKGQVMWQAASKVTPLSLSALER